MRFCPARANSVLSCDWATEVEMLASPLKAAHGNLTDGFRQFRPYFQLQFIVNVGHLRPG